MGFSGKHLEKRISEDSFFKRIKKLVDWKAIGKEITKDYKRGYSVDGRPSYSGLLLFQMLLIGIWYNLSDEKVEKSVRVNIEMMYFCDLDIEDNVSDHSVLSRFRSEFTRGGTFDRLLKMINRQLASHNAIIGNGVGIIDATLTDTPCCPKGKVGY